MRHDPTKQLARRRFAEAERSKIVDALREHERALWLDAAKRAKEAGLYAATTYDGDAAHGLQSHAGVRAGIVWVGQRALEGRS